MRPRNRISPLALVLVAILVLSEINLVSWLGATLQSAAAIINREAPGIDRRSLLLGGLGLILVIYVCVLSRDKRHASRSRRRGGSLHSGPPFKQRPLLNKGEGRLLAVLDHVVPEIWGPTTRVCPQVSYGEFLSCSKFSKFARMNSRRADFVVITDDHRVALVVELQGSGHFGSTSKSAWKARNADQTKRSAMTEAGIPFLEVGSNASEASVTKQIRARIASRAATIHKEGYNHV